MREDALEVFELDENNEATGCTELYCSEKCWESGKSKSVFAKQSDPKEVDGSVSGCVCIECGKRIE